MAEAKVHLAVVGGVAQVTLDRPPLNLLDAEMLEALVFLAQGPLAAPEVRAVLLSGGGGVFSAGADVAALADPRSRLRLFQLGRRALGLIAALGVPVIALLEGSVLGGGLELALTADLRWAAAHASLGLPEVGLGIMPAWGGTQRLPRIIGSGRALELMWTHERLTAAQALQLGLVTRVLPEGQPGPQARELAARLAQGAPLAQRAAKRAVRAGLETSLESGLDLEATELMRLMASEDAAEGLRSFLERRAPVFSGR